MATKIQKDADEGAQPPPTSLTAAAQQLSEALALSSSSDDDAIKAAKVQLLKAAKKDPTSARAFALLGYALEYLGDVTRAAGCFQKALGLDSSEPVAGRGYLRVMTQPSKIQSRILEQAVHGAWAWRALAQQNMLEGNDALAVVAFLQCLRCPDVGDASQEEAVFYVNPNSYRQGSSSPSKACVEEKVAILTDLASCYRRLGRYTAAVRSYHAAMQEYETESSPEAEESSPDQLQESPPPDLLCKCAQIELELGLMDDAADKFARAVAALDDDCNSIVWARYGLGMALMQVAQRDLGLGKVQSAYEILNRALDACSNDNSRFMAVHKLRGDIYTAASALPVQVFGDKQQAWLDFVAQGEAAYQQAEASVVETDQNHGGDDDEQTITDSQAQKASLAADCGTNLLLRAQKLYQWTNGGNINNDDTADLVSSEPLFQQAAQHFRRALELDPTHATAWCGLGCSLHKEDPLLAQHSFCRALELDPSLATAYSNLCFLYTRFERNDPADSVSNALTTVADTPLHWIHRALVLEKQDKLPQASDAYRAALQVDQHPTAMLGVALTNTWIRNGTAIAGGEGKDDDGDTHGGTLESYAYTSEYLGGNAASDPSISILNGLLLMELGLEDALPESKTCVQEGRRQVASGRVALTENDEDNNDGWDHLLLDHILEAQDGELDDPQVTEQQEPSSQLSLTRQIIHEPARGDLWLDLAKELAQQVPISLPQTLSAARRAVRILSQQKSSAKDLSDAITLVYWLENCNDEESSSTPTAASPSCSDTELQRAILLCPNNLLAREALKQRSHQ